MQIGFCGLLTILFIGLKLTGYIAWSWIWVFAPVWLPFVVVFVFVPLVLLLGAFIWATIETMANKKW